MARKKYKQRQQARLFYDGKDHRDVIYNENYINAIFYGNRLSIPDWRQYKRKFLVGIVRGKHKTYPSYMQNYMMGIDVENRFISFQPSHYPYEFISTSFRSNGRITMIEDSTRMVSFNGHDWSVLRCDVLPTNIDPYLASGFKISGNGGVCACSTILSKSYPSIKVAFYDVIKNGYEDKISEDMKYVDHYAVYSSLVSFTPFDDLDQTYSGSTDVTYMGISKNGVIIRTTKPTKNSTYNKVEKLFNVTPSGATLLHEEIKSGTSTTQDFSSNYVMLRDNKYLITHSYKTSTTPNQQGVYIYWADADNPTVWNQQIIVPQEPLIANGISSSTYYRNGYWYMFLRQSYYVGKNTKYSFTLKKSSNLSDWEDVPLPLYLDVSIMEDDGTHGTIGTTNYKKVRIVFDTRQTIPTESDAYNYVFTPLTDASDGINGYETESYFSLMYSNGIAYMDRPFDFFVSFAITTGSNYTYIYYYLDNMNFQESDGNFAFILPTRIYNNKGEVVQEDDYCNPK